MTLAHIKIDPLIKQALNEDITPSDLSAQAIFKPGQIATVQLLAKDQGLIAGLPVFQRVFELLDDRDDFSIRYHKREGGQVEKGDVIAELRGDVQVLLSGERVALNFLQRMSGIATATEKLASALAEEGEVKLQDTRKTTPGLHLLEKYAVRLGGGVNHRYNLSDMIMLKDNHLAAAGGIQPAIEKARRRSPFVYKIEVEVESLDQVMEAVEAGADIIMLDNFALNEIDQAVDLIDGQAIIECSGNISQDNIQDYARRQIDYISSGAITHSAGILDLSMKNLQLEADPTKFV